jgi:5-methylcytosine-specific restriction endonuclease McrA
MKVCKDCQVNKPLSDYHKNKNTKDGVTIVCKPCATERSRKWQASNPERVRAVGRKNYAKNLEQSRAKRRKRVNLWYQNHKEEERKRNRDYAISNPEAKRLSEQRRRIRKIGNGEFLILPKETNKLLTGNCFGCGSKENITLDHIIPISRGGQHSVGNLQPLCKSCNSSKNAKTIMEWRIACGALR